MTRIAFLFAAVVLLPSAAFSQDGETEVFSGPQVGEPLPGFSMTVALGGKPGSEVDFVSAAGDSPVVVIFIHQLTRPGFALANAVMKYSGDVEDVKIHRGICFLSQDPTQAQTQIDRAKRYFPKDTFVGYSMEGIEGPGSYGLNRNVQVTVVVARRKQVLANFALVQPGVHADGPKILNAIAKAVDVADKPDINKYLPNNQAAQDAPIAIDPALMAAVRRLSMKDADEAAVKKAIAEIEALIKDKEPLQRQLASIAVRWVRSKRVNEIGTKEQQTTITMWARKLTAARGRQNNTMQRAEKLTDLLRTLIKKTNTDKQVDEAAKAIEDYVSDNESARAEWKRISTTVAYGGKLEKYGTKHCQEVLKAWADRFKTSK